MKVDYFALIMQRENMLLVGIVLLLLTNSAVNGALISVLRLKPSSHRGKTIFIYTRLSQNFLFNSLHSIFSEYLGKPPMDGNSFDKPGLDKSGIQLHGNLLNGDLLKIFGLSPYRIVFYPGPTLLKMYK